MTLEQFLSAHRELLALLMPLYLVAWSLVMSLLADATKKWAWLSKAFHVLALSPAPRSKADAVADAIKVLESEK